VDYTTSANVKQALGADTTGDDALVARLITEASRTIDRHCAGGRLDSDDYLKLEAVTDELVSGQVDNHGSILCRPFKPLVTAVTAVFYRTSPMMEWKSVAVTNVTIDGHRVTVWAGVIGRGKVEVKISYTGGLAATVSALPGDITNAADLLSVRFYREIKSNLSDSIGVAELGTLQYTKAMPVRLIEMLKPYKRALI
jgi:hypothetical protein